MRGKRNNKLLELVSTMPRDEGSGAATSPVLPKFVGIRSLFAPYSHSVTAVRKDAEAVDTDRHCGL